MPTMTRITQKQVEDVRIFPLGARIQDEDFSKVRDAWINRSGILFYAGYYNHEESAHVLGFDSADSAEIAGWIHISSCYNGKPQIVNGIARYTKAQLDTYAYYCSVHGIKNILE